jgi:hypothetical protein
MKVTVVFWRFLGAVMVPMIAVVTLGFGSVDLGPALRAARGEGTPGVFQVHSRECARTCHLYGDFISSDGSITWTGVEYDGPRGLKIGDKIPVLATGGRDKVFRPSGSREWIFILIAMVFGAGCTLWWLWRYPWRALRRRRGPAVQQLVTATDTAEYDRRRGRAV